MKRIRGAIRLLLIAVCILLPMVSSGTTDYDEAIASMLESGKEALYDVSLNAPFTKEKSGIRETIDPETGALRISYVLGELKGRAGAVNETLLISYDSRSAKLKEEDIKYVDGYKNYTRTKTKAEKRSEIFGTGFSLYMPSVDGEKKSKTYIHMPTGEVYKYSSKEETGLFEYERNDATFKIKTEKTEGIESRYCLTYIDGTAYRFDKYGNLVLKTDRFKNAVYYEWEEKNDSYRLTKIYDNSSNFVSFEYGENTVITVNGKSYVLNIEEYEETGENVLKSISDPYGTRVSFSYKEEQIYFTFIENVTKKTNTYLPIESVTYESGLVTKYTYEKAKKWFNESDEGYIEYVKVKSRYDMEGDTVKNRITYEYEGAPDGYPKHKSDDLPDDYTYTMTETDIYGVVTKRVYDSKHNIAEKSIYDGKRQYEKELTQYHPDTKMPTGKTTYTYDEKGSYSEMITELSYDSHSNLIREDKFAKGGKRGENEVLYAYGSYNVCISRKYNMDEDTKIEIKRELGEMGNVTKETVYENKTPVKSASYSYDGWGNVTESVTDAGKTGERTERYTYDEENHRYPVKVIISGIAEADGGATSVIEEYTYDTEGNVLTYKNDSGHITGYTYDKKNRRTEERLPDGNKRTWIYDDKKNTIETKDAANHSLFYSYDMTGSLKSVFDKTKGVYLLNAVYDDGGRLIKETDANGNTRTYFYDNVGRYVKIEDRDSSGKLMAETRASYEEVFEDKNMRLTVSTGIDAERVTEYVFDEFGRTIKETVKGNDASRSMYYSYDIAGNLLTEEDNAGRITRYEYDGLGNPLIVTRADGVKESYEYDPLGNVLMHINGEGEVTNFGYDVLGRNIYTDNGISRVEYYYDGQGNVLREKDGNGNITYYTYDSRGFLSTGKKGSIITEYLYDGEGRVIKQSYGATGEKDRISQYYEISEDGLLLKETDNLSQSAYYSYDDLGNLVKYTDKNGVTTSYVYDGLNRIVKEANGVDADITYTYDSLGQLSKVQRGESYISYSYDGIGQVVSEKSENGEKRYSYDKVGNLTEKYIYDKMGVELESSYTYDSLSQITSINTHMGKEVLSYDRAGRITKSENTSTGESIRYWYNRDNTVSKVIHENNGEMLFSEHYEYDKNGNRIYAAMDTEITEYTYDKNDRLTRVKKNDDYVIYEFDSFSNIKTEYTTKGNFIDRKEYYYDKLNRLTVMMEGDVTTSYSYDKKGQLTEKRKMYSDSSVTESYVYSGRGELVNVFGDNLTAEYTYGADGYRSGKTVNGETSRFVYDGMNIVAEVADGTVYRYARGSRLLGYDSSKGDSVYYRQNAHGDVIALTNGIGDIIWDYTYDAYGEEEKKSNNPFRRAFGKKEPHNPFRYAGEYTDEETGLIYLRARYYDSSIGRFTSEDPIKDGLNWYVYCGANPVNRVDPWGLAPTPEEAAYMAEHIYHYDENSSKEDRTIAGWRLIDVFDGSIASSIKLGIYIPDEDDWQNPSEYALVFRGSTTNLSLETASVWINNIEAVISDDSVDLKAAIGAAIYFDAMHSQEITFVGHSKGGGEAIAAASVTGNNAITFNAADFSFEFYNVYESNRANINNYYIEGEILSSLFFLGEAHYGTNTTLDTVYYNDKGKPELIENHSMKAFAVAWNLDWSMYEKFEK